MGKKASRTLIELQSLKYEVDTASTRRQIALLRKLERERLGTSEEVTALHEALCFLRAFPPGAGLHALVLRMLRKFDRRPDFVRHSAELADTGIAGTPLFFRFYWLTADWLIEQGWGPQLEIDWDEFENKERLEDLLALLHPYSETPAFDALSFTPKEWIDRLKGPKETDAEFLLRRFQALRVPQEVREQLFEDLDVPFILNPGRTTPARSREQWPMPIVFRTRPIEAERPDLRAAIHSASVIPRSVTPRVGRQLIDLANGCMVPRHRDLLVFLHGDERDVRLVDCGDGLQFVCIGAKPERRLLLESVYGFLTLMNGAPIGYVLCSGLFGSSEVAYNVFETFRGRGAAQVYAQVLAVTHRLFGADTFAVDPYQLGHDNEEGQLSGAWWFYYKLGFRPHDAGVKRLVREELRRMERKRDYRTPPERLNDLAAAYMFLSLNKPRTDVLGHVSLGNIGLRISEYLARRFGADRERGLEVCSEEAASLLRIRDLDRWSKGERLAFTRWAPLVLAVPGVGRWPSGDRRALAAVMRAKGGHRECDFVDLFDAHARLRKAVLQLAAR